MSATFPTGARARTPAPGLVGTLAGVVLVGALAAAALLALARVDRTFELWPISRSVGEVFKLRAGQTVTQIVDLPLGVARGFAVAIDPEFGPAPTIEFVLRLRRADGAHDILRESRAVVTELGPQTVSTGVLAPIAGERSRRVMLEVGIAPDSDGKAVVFATTRTNVPAGGLAVNGAPSPDFARANVAPLVTVSTIGVLRALLAENAPVSLAYLGAATALVAAAAWLLLSAWSELRRRRVSSRVHILAALAALSVLALSLALDAATFVPGSLRDFMTEILDSYWSAALPVPWLALVVAGTLRAGVWWWTRAHSSGARIADLWRPRLWWRPAIASSLAVFLVALGPALWRQEIVAQTLGAAAVLLLVFGLVGGMLAELRRWP